ncbi:MAG: DUF6883 domain-containing protein [Steroidobacterales bacterium]
MAGYSVVIFSHNYFRVRNREFQARTTVERAPTRYGRKYEVSGILRGPSGRESVVKTVWMVGHGEDFPRGNDKDVVTVRSATKKKASAHNGKPGARSATSG